ncbi:MAG: M18 family aminopeptidase [Azonexus sp.]|jgi:aspartyl aminopeptidase|nr:M18 family aminopeptidase [Azonexus sp.]
MNIAATVRAQAQDLLHFIDAGPSPWHVVHECAERLAAAGFKRLDEGERWRLPPGSRCYLTRGGSLVAFITGGNADQGLTLIGAHTDSPGLRVKPRAADESGGLWRVGVEVYGSPILATFADRDLTLAGRVNVRSGQGFASHLVRFAQPLLRLPNLAIHMNREVNEVGLKFNRQSELPLLLGLADDGASGERRFRQLIAEQCGVAPEDLLTWDLAAADTQAGSFWGPNSEFIASSRLDNLASCHAALCALLAVSADAPARAALIALFDHEEVGSESAVGAGGSLAADVIARLAASAGQDAEDQRRRLARSFFISADMAHAWHPNFPAAYEPGHHVLVNGGPVIKSNANQRYSTTADSAARFMGFCAAASVPCQHYAHRADLGCGSTIGPLVAARLGVASVDVGSPLWAMHSIRESAGVLDHAAMIAALTAALRRASAAAM